MAMKMLEAGGMPVVTDGLRAADGSNPNGYFEFEPVKELERGDAAWLAEARGKAVKIISPLMTYLPESYDYQVIFMRRTLDEIIASQHAMLDARGAERGAADARTRELYEAASAPGRSLPGATALLLDAAGRLLQVLAEPRAQAKQIQAFLGGALDTGAMASVADPALHRNKRQV